MKKYAIKTLALCTMERKDARDAVLSEKGESITCEKGECGRDNNVIHQPRLVHIGKNCSLCLGYGLGLYSRPQAQFFPIWTSGW